jgi:hypothetical protein
VLSLSSREIAAGAGWSRVLKNGNSISAGLDWATLSTRLKLSDLGSEADVTSNSFSLSVGYTLF